MSKILGPLFSFGGIGQVGKALIFSKWKGIRIARRHAIPSNPNSASQQVQRGLVSASMSAWSTSGLTDIDRAAFDFLAGLSHDKVTGYNSFLRDSLKISISGSSPAYSNSFGESAGGPRGLTWEDLGQQFSQASILSLCSVGGGVCLAGTGTGGKILRSVDSGLTWEDLGQQFSQASILSLCTVGGGVCLAGTGTDGKILRSVDGGLTWDDLGKQGNQASIFALIAVGGGVCLAGTGNDCKILRSIDYGATWSDPGVLWPDFYCYSLCTLGGGVCLAGTGYGGLVLRSTDSGENWTSLGKLAGESRVYSLIPLGGGVVLAGTGTHGKICRSVDYGETWADLGQQVAQASIFSFATEDGYIVVSGTGVGGKILRSVAALPSLFVSCGDGSLDVDMLFGLSPRALVSRVQGVFSVPDGGYLFDKSALVSGLEYYLKFESRTGDNVVVSGVYSYIPE